MRGKPFAVGDRVRIGGLGNRLLPAPYRGWVRRGRVAKIIAIRRGGRNRHTRYYFDGRRRKPAIWLERFHLRSIDVRDRAAPLAT